MNFNDVAIFLDLDNLVIGATEVNLTFDINLILKHIAEVTNGRIVLRRAYGDWQQHQTVIKGLATAGFELQSIVRLNHMSKNLADMQMVVDAMETLIDGHNFTTYVLMTGDRDFVPVVQALRKRGKQVIGMGLKHTTSKSLVDLCDQYIYYEELSPPSHKLQDQDVTKLLQQALDQLLQDKVRVPASLLKQRLHTLSQGSFTRSKQGKKNFRALLNRYPALVQVEQEGTTLYVGRPQDKSVQIKAQTVNATAVADEPGEVVLITAKAQSALLTVDKEVKNGETVLTETAVENLLRLALARVPEDQNRVRASLLKQWMRELSNGVFNDYPQGARGFRQFLEKYPHLIQIKHEGTTLYVGPLETQTAAPETKVVENKRPLSAEEIEELLQRTLADLLADQPRLRASLLKQSLQESSGGTFDETSLGDRNFRQFLERFPHLIELQQTGSTLFVAQPQKSVEPVELHLRYRTALKKQGLRVVPSNIRLVVLKDMIQLLQHKEGIRWQELVTSLADYYQEKGDESISKSFIGDVMRVAQRAEVLQVATDVPWTQSPVRLKLQGDKLFQEAVMRCDAVYLQAIRSATESFDLEEAAVALYETVGHTRYLQVVWNRHSSNGQHKAA